MDEREQAAAWVRDQLARARESFRRQPPGPYDLSLEQYESQLRARADAILRPTSSYVGLLLDDARTAASSNGDSLCPHRGPTGHRGNWRADRVHVELDAEDRVQTARRDHAPWHVAP